MNTKHGANTEFPNPQQEISVGREKKKNNVLKINSFSSLYFMKGNGYIINHYFQ